MGRFAGVMAFGLMLAAAWPCAAGQLWEIKTTGGYLSGSRIVLNAAGAEQFPERPGSGRQHFLPYDKEGKFPLVGQGEASLWDFEERGPGEVFIRAAEGKWQGWYLRTSDRALKDGPSFGCLLELSREPQTFFVYQVSR